MSAIESGISMAAGSSLGGVSVGVEAPSMGSVVGANAFSGLETFAVAPEMTDTVIGANPLTDPGWVNLSGVQLGQEDAQLSTNLHVVREATQVAQQTWDSWEPSVVREARVIAQASVETPTPDVWSSPQVSEYMGMFGLSISPEGPEKTFENIPEVGSSALGKTAEQSTEKSASSDEAVLEKVRELALKEELPDVVKNAEKIVEDRKANTGDATPEEKAQDVVKEAKEEEFRTDETDKKKAEKEDAFPREEEEKDKKEQKKEEKEPEEPIVPVLQPELDDARANIALMIVSKFAEATEHGVEVDLEKASPVVEEVLQSVDSLKSGILFEANTTYDGSLQGLAQEMGQQGKVARERLPEVVQSAAKAHQGVTIGKPSQGRPLAPEKNVREVMSGSRRWASISVI